MSGCLTWLPVCSSSRLPVALAAGWNFAVLLLPRPILFFFRCFVPYPLLWSRPLSVPIRPGIRDFPYEIRDAARLLHEHSWLSVKSGKRRACSRRTRPSVFENHRYHLSHFRMRIPAASAVWQLNKSSRVDILARYQFAFARRLCASWPRQLPSYVGSLREFSESLLYGAAVALRLQFV